MEIITNLNGKTLYKKITSQTSLFDLVDIGVAFFSEESLFELWLQNNIKIRLLVSLRPPTNYFHLKRFMREKNIEIKFYRSNFHSKLYIFKKGKNGIFAVVGSSNFTGGGLKSNIECNLVLNKVDEIGESGAMFNELWDGGDYLEPEDLIKYKKRYLIFLSNRRREDKQQKKFEKGMRNTSKPAKYTGKLHPSAASYHKFWKSIDHVKDLLQYELKKEYPRIPAYIPIDHFWHWIKTEWDRKQSKGLQTDNDYRDKQLPILFRKYSKWEKETSSHVDEMYNNAKYISKTLSKTNIKSLTKMDAKKIYPMLHSGFSRSQRFYADKLFVEKNSIRMIRNSLNYLLHSKDDVAVRIHNILRDLNYKLHEVGPSVAQELLGWAHPGKYPLRNTKADYAATLLGYFE